MMGFAFAQPILHVFPALIRRGAAELRLFRYRQRLADLVDDHDQDLCGFGIARIAGHCMELAGRLIEGLADALPVSGPLSTLIL